MKSQILCLALCVATVVAPFAPVPLRAAEDVQRKGMDEATRFIFYSVMEGLYEDGLSKEDVAQILKRTNVEQRQDKDYGARVQAHWDKLKGKAPVSQRREDRVKKAPLKT